MSIYRNYRSGENVSIVLPTLNEAENILVLIEDIVRYCPKISEVIVVDDNSSDGTSELVADYSSKHPNINIIVEKRLSDHGLTKSIRRGVELASQEIVIWMDCDLSMPAKLIPKLLSGLDFGYDLAVGSRFVKNGSFKQNTKDTSDSALAVALSRGMNYFIQVLLGQNFRDYTSGFIAIRRSLVQQIGLRGDYGEYFIDLIFRLQKKGLKIIEIPYICLPRERGESKTGQNILQYISRGQKYISVCLQLRLESIFNRKKFNSPIESNLQNENFQINSGEKTFSVEVAVVEDIPFIANLHERALRDTVNSRLGSPILQELYDSILRDPCSKVWKLLDSQQNIIGFSAVSEDLFTTEKRLKVSLVSKMLVIPSFLAHWSYIWKIVQHRALVSFCSKKLGNPYPTILTIGIDPRFQNLNLGSMLLAKIEDHFKSQSIHNYYVDTLENNTQAKKFYERNTFLQKANVAGNLIYQKSFEVQQ